MKMADMTPDLFAEPRTEDGRVPPLADRMRPSGIDQLFGQAHVLSDESFLRAAILEDSLPSMILWGPPGCGKTSLAHVVASTSQAVFAPFSAVLGGLKDVRELVHAAKARARGGERTILFVDEIHRFNKGQQDAFLPHVESGVITLIGATTENPSFALNAALMSRCRLIQLKALAPDALRSMLENALDDQERGLGVLGLNATDAFLDGLAAVADGDARRALNSLEQIAEWARVKGKSILDVPMLGEVLGDGRAIRHDKAGDAHYDLVSAFIKSMRGSDPDAALYYCARMVEVGEDPRFILRRILIFASEDVGNADPRALQIALAASQAYERLGMPEGALPMAQAVTYCASAPKSNASYSGWKKALEDARKSGSLEIPMHLRNAPTKLMKSLGNAEGYRYPHDEQGHFVREEYLPTPLRGRSYYRPSDQGYEQRIAERLRRWWSDEGDQGSDE